MEAYINCKCIFAVIAVTSVAPGWPQHAEKHILDALATAD